MGDLKDIAMVMLWLVALFLLLTNATGASQLLQSVGSTWFSGIRTLQGR